MALTAYNFISQESRVVDELQEEAANPVRYTPSMLLRYLNESQRLIVSLRPDATATIKSPQLAPGTKQTIPTGDVRLIEVIRNMGANGTTPGRPILKADKIALDRYSITWHSETASTTVREYIFDERFPRDFYVTPPVHASTAVYAEIVVAAAPVDCTGEESNIGIPDIYQTALIESMLWMAFSMDIDSQANQARAAFHLQHLYQVLGVKMQADNWANPRVRRPASPSAGNMA